MAHPSVGEWWRGHQGRWWRHDRRRRLRQTGRGAIALMVAALMTLAGVVVAATPAAAAIAGSQVFTWGSNDQGQLGRTTPALGSATPGAVSLPLPAGTLLTDLAVGVGHVLAATSTGTVYAWGYNNLGQVGNGTTTEQRSPVPVSMPAGVTVRAVAAGPQLSLALTSTGDVYSWGDPSTLGRSDTSTNTTPGRVELPPGTVATAISAGTTHAAVVTSTGQVYAWGDNADGELGTGGTDDSDLPTLMTLPPGVQAAKVAAGLFYTLVLTTSGQVYGTGTNEVGQLGDGTTTDRTTPVPALAPAGTVFTAIAAKLDSSLGLTSEGQVWGWGNYNQASTGSASSTRPVRVAALPKGVVFTGMSAGLSHNLAVAANQQVYAWGTNNRGQLGDGTTTDRASAVRVPLPEGAEATVVAAGAYFSAVMVRTTLDLAFGANGSGQLGNYSHDNSFVPVSVALPGNMDMIDMEGGYLHSVAVTNVGEVWAWGDNAYGQLGDGTQTSRSAPVQSLMPAGTNAVKVTAGQRHTLALTDAGKVFAWGGNNVGQLGIGSTTPATVLTPTLVTFPGSLTGTVTQIASHNFHSAALTSTGEVYTWGDNTYGQIGNGTTTRQTSPVKISLPGGATATSIAVGAFHTLVVTSTGAAYAWGYNNYGQLGNGTNTNSSVPVAVSLPSGTLLRDIDAGLSHSLAITTAGRALAWGANSVGQLGNGTTNAAGLNVPVSVHLPAGVELVGIAGGQSHSLAVTTGGQVLAWGLNNYGQLGENNSVPARTTPTYVDQTPGTVADDVAAGQFHSLVR
ncbi:hypothetical protein [Micromonospora sp. HUAS LYJ1]|uniref:RCC1-like domain-containing protein n=1 Tax=Micromonospora sp. HUAS LYJ1 TaxID=3061626 RepID=UPI0026734164|nr:hypothetical protein [Micromonospora sp. HUAS LYJ1]WKU07154.1 hypothetical protein Q2K16_08915 [Micromonospora sp. HUAS LYJ1]